MKYIKQKNTELEKEYLKGEYEPLTVMQAVERCKELYYFFWALKKKNTMPVANKI